MAVWEQVYVPLITFLDPEGLRMLSQEMTTLRMRDPDDVPTGQLAAAVLAVSAQTPLDLQSPFRYRFVREPLVSSWFF